MGASVTGHTSRRKSNLPVELTSFVGRREETAAVKRLLSESRLVTLTGPGGVGKTRLALRAAELLRRAFPDGVWLASLAELRDPGLLAQTVAAALDVQDYSTQDLMVTLTEFLRPRQLLLVMDNCEHLLEECAALAKGLLLSAPDLRVLATSRQSLGVAGEQAWPVPSISVPDAPPDSDVPSVVPVTKLLARSDAVRLFTERARSVLPGFELTPQNGSAVLEICRHLDGIPLALELAVVRLRALSPEQIRERLDDRFRLLTKGNRADIPRHQTLHALIDWSYHYCTEPERALWGRVSVFSGGFDLIAAEQVCAGDGIATEAVPDLLDALVDKSVLSIHYDGGLVRYGMLETIRQYGQDKLSSSGGWPALRRRHCNYFQKLAEDAHRRWCGPDQVALVTTLRRELGNLRAAQEFCLTEPGRAWICLAIATNLYFFYLLGYLSEGRRWHDRALARVPERTCARADGLLANAWLAHHQGDDAGAKRMLQECRSVAEQLGDRSNLARADTVAGRVGMCGGDLTAAVALLERSLAEHLALGDLEWITLAKDLLPAAVYMSGEIDRAVALCEECVAFCEAHGEIWLRSWVLYHFSVAVWRQGDLRYAKALAQESLRIKKSLDDRLGASYCLEHLASIAASDNPESAARLFGATQTILQAIGVSQSGYQQANHKRYLAATRAELGEKAFTSAFRSGTELTIEEAIAEAMQEKKTKKSATTSTRPTEHVCLTAREQEVAGLVAEGLTNKEIARRLVISQRTADCHIQNIMIKLGFNSRTQIAVLAAVPENRTPNAED